MENLLTIDDCNRFLYGYNLAPATEMKVMDSSHGEDDIRQNYILDKKYVIRLNNAEVFDENRFEELNRLVRRYREFGIKAPLFLKNQKGRYLERLNGLSLYVSEYIDGFVPPEEISAEKEKILVQERLELIAKFAEKYKNTDLSCNMSMYSLFDLSPYDILEGIDEKESNLNNLLAKLETLGEHELSEQLRQYDSNLRNELKKVYKSLPKCVFQGDENWGNLIVDENYHITGLFDFNMAGTDVVVNYFANNALLLPAVLAEDEFADMPMEEVFARLKNDFGQNTEILRAHYKFSEAENYAYALYAGIAVISIYPNECAIEYWLDDDTTKEKALKLLKMITAAK